MFSQPYQLQLFGMSMFLVGMMMGGTVPSAWIFRNIRSWTFVIGSFVVSVIMIFVVFFVSMTGSPVATSIASMIFGAAVGSTLGSFVVAVTDGEPRGAEAVAITLAIVAMSTFGAAAVGLFSGFNFQGIGGIMFVLLLVLLGISVLALFVRWGRTMEFVIGISASLFWIVYMVYDFNKIVYRYTEATWPAAADIAMNLYLDMVNLFIRLLPLIMELLSDSK